ncbi:MAG TPA: DUF6789 family protein [Roseiflexaceae bacterium]|nr:DUF6789 family protein [Roseiflexaceae bacterium]
MGSATANTRAAVSPLPDIIGLGGALAGLIGGLAMALVAALMAFVQRQDIWREAKAISIVVLGPQAAAQPGFAALPVLTGTLIHLIIAMLLGALFGIVTRRWLHLPSDFGIPLVAGLSYGLLVWLIAYFVVLPLADPWLLDSYAPAFIVQHIVYGSVTGLCYAWLQPSPYDASE